MTKEIYTKGMIVKGCVTGIEKYGIFVGLDDCYTGLIHISEISDSFVRNIEDYVDVGEIINVEIIELDDCHSRAKLSIKNIDYRINKKKKTKIVEVGSGFGCLRNKLDNWIKIAEVKKSEKMHKN